VRFIQNLHGKWKQWGLWLSKIICFNFLSFFTPPLSLWVNHSSLWWSVFIPKCLNKLDFNAAIFRWVAVEINTAWQWQAEQNIVFYHASTNKQATTCGQTTTASNEKYQQYNLKVPTGLIYAAFRLEISTSGLLSYLYMHILLNCNLICE